MSARRVPEVLNASTEGVLVISKDLLKDLEVTFNDEEGTVIIKLKTGEKQCLHLGAKYEKKQPMTIEVWKE